MPHIDAMLLIAIAVSAGGLGLWFGLFGVALLATRPTEVRPAAPHQDLSGAEPPALVSLLTNAWEITEDAAESTLIDLAARRYLEFRQPANEPLQTTVHVREPAPEGLTRYESTILGRVVGLAVDGVVPLTALTFRDKGEARRFSARLTRQIVADARDRGLSQRRFSRSLAAALSLAGAVPAVAVAAGLLMIAAPHHKLTDVVGLSLMGLIPVWLMCLVLAVREHGERDTPRSREVAARWLGLQAFLRGDESFAELPPAAVAVWDRYLSFGAAVGAARVCSAVIHLGLGSRTRVWSAYGGTWHRVRVRYPRFWPRYGQLTGRLAVKGAVAFAIGAVLVGTGGGHQLLSVLMSPSVADYVRPVSTALSLWLLLYGVYTLIGAVVDLATPTTVTGEVLWTETWKRRRAGDDQPSVPWLARMAVDDGTGDSTRAWGVPVELVGEIAPGDVVTVTARRFTRRVATLHVDTVGPGRAVRAATDHLTGTVSIAELLQVDEVARVFGQHVTLRGQPKSPGGNDSWEYYVSSATGQKIMLASVTVNTAPQFVVKLRRYTRLPGIGDEAFGDHTFAYGRRGIRTVQLRVAQAARGVPAQGIYWLLATAVSRLPPD
jgi:hypothetical protein